MNPAWWLHKLSVPWPRTYDQKWWRYLSSQRKNIMSEPFPKHAAFLSRYFNHEPTNNSVLVNYNTLDRKWRCSRLKLLRPWISCGCHASSGCNGPRTQRHKRSFSWKTCNYATSWTWHVCHSGRAGALMAWDQLITPQHEFSQQRSEEDSRANLEEGKQAGCEDKWSGSLNTYNQISSNFTTLNFRHFSSQKNPVEC